MKSFNSLPIYLKSEIVFNDAQYVNGIAYHHFTAALYALDGQFFEVFYSPYTNSIKNISLADYNRLHLYCPQIEEME